MQSNSKSLTVTQIAAAIGLGVSSFLPFYTNAMGEVQYANPSMIFFWPIPAFILIYLVSIRWLKVLLCVLFSIGSLAPWVLITFLGTFKSHPLVGFHLARLSIIVLVLSWIILAVTTFANRPSQPVSPAEEIEH